MFDVSGNFISAWGSFGTENGNFLYPKSLTSDPSGNILVVDAGNRNITKFSPGGVFLTVWQSTAPMTSFIYWPENGQIYSPTGIETDPSGNVYVTEGNLEGDFVNTPSNRVQKFDSGGNFLMKILRCRCKRHRQGSGPRGIAFDRNGELCAMRL